MRMLQKFGLALLVLCLAIAVCEVLSIAQVSPRPVAATYLLIVPGQTVGPLSLGDTRDKAISLFPPKPNVDQEFPQKPDCGTEFNWVDIKDYPKFRGNVFMRLRENIVFQIDSATTRYRTKEGITIGSPPEDVRRHYPHLLSYILSNMFSEAQGGRPLVYWVDREQGIAFAFAYSRRTRRRSLGQIIVFKPNSEICPTDDSIDSLAKRELKPYSLEPDEK